MNNTQNKDKIIHVFRMAYFVRCKVIKKWRKMAKKSRNRFLKLREWYDTQQSYLQRLKTLRDGVKAPMIKQGFISQYQQVLIFPNLDSMIHLGEQMKQNINQLIKSWNPITTQLAPTVGRLVNFLKIYKQYSNNFQKADKIIQEIKKDPRFGEVVKVPFIEDYLIKPVQRPLQYKLFISDYLGAMPKSHLDRPQLEKALKKVLNIADEINQSVEEQIRSQKIIKLQQIFKDIIESTRTFKSSFYAQHLDLRCNVYVLNDLLLIAKQLSNHREEPYMKIFLCHNSYIIRKHASKCFKQRLFICGTYNSIHLTFQSKFDIDSAQITLNELINILVQKQTSRMELIRQAQLKKQTMLMNRYSLDNNTYKWKEQQQYKLNLRVTVLGCCQRIISLGVKIFYFVKIQLPPPANIYQLAVYQMDEFRKIQQYLHYVFKKIQIPSIDSKFKQLYNETVSSDFTKFFEYKSMAIQIFLNAILRCPEVCKSPQFILFKLRIHQCLWDYINKSSIAASCSCKACQSIPEFNGIQFFSEVRKQIQDATYPFCIQKAFNCQKILATQISQKQFLALGIDDRLLWAACKQNRIVHQLLQSDVGPSKVIQFHIRLNLSSEFQYFPIQQTSSCTVRSLIKQICGIRNFGDGRDLILTIASGNDSVFLDDDESIIEIYKQISGESKAEENFMKRASLRGTLFQSLSTNFETKEMGGHKKIELVLRKMYTFNKKLEEKACQKNIERYNIVLGEFLHRFKIGKVFVPTSELKQICAYFYMLEEFNKLVFSKKVFFNEELLKHYLPQDKWNYIGPQFIKECELIVQDSIKTIKSIDILYKKSHQKIQDIIGWRYTFFDVYKIDQHQKNPPKLFIGISMEGVMLFQPYAHKILNQLSFSNFSYKISGDMLWVVMENDEIFKFKGSNFMMLESMLNRFKLLHQYSMSGASSQMKQ